ncbi:MAG: rRNA pseudouridine synthase [Chthoniobacterales bacterium]|nr:rRNA pseudouridine synthase [Chthoniobacterales bacterium]
MNQPMRLNRYLALCGLGSRRACEEIILRGGVRVNGRAVRELATVVQAGDTVFARGREVRPAAARYLVLHKPSGCLSSRQSQGGKPTVYDFLPREAASLPHVGRLDAESEGLLLLSNDGALAQAITHPSRHVEKEYEVIVDRPFDVKLVPKLLKGIYLEEGRAKAVHVQIEGANKLRVVLTQGINRQIRRMFAALDYKVKRLTRTRLGPLKLGRLPRGAWRELTARELEALRSAAGARPRAARS